MPMPNSPAPASAWSPPSARVATCAISGAVGTFANIDPRVEAHVAKQARPCGRADLDPGHPARPARHVFRHARRRRRLGRAAGHRDPPPAAHRGAAKPRNSSPRARRAPPPCRTSAIRCCPRTSPASRAWCAPMCMPALENVALWHERDISHSSVERMIGPDATVTLDFALNRLADLVEKLVVYPEAMQRNLDRQGGLVHSQRRHARADRERRRPRGGLPAGAAKRDEGDRGPRQLPLAS